MRYIDSGSRDAAEVLGTWLQAELTPDVEELRWQSGFFTADSLGVFAPTLDRLRQQSGLARVLIGSNEPGTLRSDVETLFTLLGLPRPKCDFGVVSYDEGYFHPKTYHFKRADGSQAAYIGSANLTGSGVSGQHVEAGILLDTRSGDSVPILSRVASAIDDWFANPPRDGFDRVTSPSDISRLVADGVLLAVRLPQPPRVRTTSGTATGSLPRPRLRRLFALPPLPSPPTLPATAPVSPPLTAPSQQSVNLGGFPTTVFVAPNATGPTSGASALTGTALPHGAAGLVVRLSKDDTRIFSGGVGTANLSLPVESMPTIRFGILGRGGYPNRPRAEFDM